MAPMTRKSTTGVRMVMSASGPATGSRCEPPHRAAGVSCAGPCWFASVADGLHEGRDLQDVGAVELVYPPSAPLPAADGAPGVCPALPGLPAIRNCPRSVPPRTRGPPRG